MIKKNLSGMDKKDIHVDTVNFEIFARVLFLRNFTVVKFRRNKTLTK